MFVDDLDLTWNEFHSETSLFDYSACVVDQRQSFLKTQDHKRFFDSDFPLYREVNFSHE